MIDLEGYADKDSASREEMQIYLQFPEAPPI